MNRFNVESLKIEDQKVRSVYASGSQKLIEGLELSFQSDSSLDMVLTGQEIKGLAASSLPVPLDSSTITGICQRFDADMLLALEYFKPEFFTESVTVEDEDGRSTTNYVDLVVEAGLSMYDRSGVVIDRGTVSESKLYQERIAISSIIIIGPAMGKAGEDVDELSLKAGENYIGAFYPGREFISHKIFTGKEFSDVSPYFTNRNYRAAIELLEPLTHSADKKTASRAAHNMAVAYEALGDPESAEYWREKSGN